MTIHQRFSKRTGSSVSGRSLQFVDVGFGTPEHPLPGGQNLFPKKSF